MDQFNWPSLILGSIASLVVTALVAVFALVLEYRTGLFSSRRKKELTVRTLAYNSLLGRTDKSIGERLEVLFDGMPVKSPAMIVLEISNSGNTPITPSDFQQPIRITLEGDHILHYVISNSNPGNLRPELIRGEASLAGGEWVGDYIRIEPLLLNARESFIVSLIADGNHRSAIHVDVRIIGAEIRTGSRKKSPLERLMSSPGPGTNISDLVVFLLVLIAILAIVYLALTQLAP